MIPDSYIISRDSKALLSLRSPLALPQASISESSSVSAVRIPQSLIQGVRYEIELLPDVFNGQCKAALKFYEQPGEGTQNRSR